MPPSDVRLIDPTFGRLVTAVLQATKAANGRARHDRIDKDTLAWHRALRRVWRRPSGRQEWPRKTSPFNAPLVRVAWWTDRLARKHWRVVGTRRSYLEWQWANWPLAGHDLWHVYPDRLLWRKAAGREELLAACACGVVGRPEAISWTGERCGPCHDRLEEEGASPQRPFKVEWKKHTNAVVRAAFPHAGGVVTGGADGRVVQWEEGGPCRVLLNRSSGYIYALAVGAQGHLAVCSAVGRLMLLDPTSGEWRTFPIPGAHYFGTALAFSPGGEWLFAGAGDRAYLVDLRGPEPALRSLARARPLTGAAFTADGQALLATEPGGRLIRVEVPSGEVTAVREGRTWPGGDAWDDDPVEGLDQAFDTSYRIACSQDGQWLVTLGPWEDWLGLHRCHLPTGSWAPLRGVPGLGMQSLAFTGPDEVQATCVDGTVAVWSLSQAELTAVWCPSTRPWYGSSFLSPGGEWLIQGHQDGTLVRLPWKDLTAATG